MKRTYNPNQLELFGPDPNLPSPEKKSRRKKPAPARQRKPQAKPPVPSAERPLIKAPHAAPRQAPAVRIFEFPTADLPKTIPVRLPSDLEKTPGSENEPYAELKDMLQGIPFWQMDAAARREIRERVVRMAQDHISASHCAAQLGLDEELVAYWYHLIDAERMTEFIEWGRLIPEYTPQMEQQTRRMLARGFSSRQIELMLGIPHNIADQWRKSP